MARLSDKIVYISDFDQLTWLVDLDQHPFYECDINWQRRPMMREWIEENCEGPVLIWNGLVTPDYGQSNYGHMVSPHPSLCHIIFLNKEDEAKFGLSMVGAPDGVVREIHRNGTAAYFHRTSK